MIKIAFGLMCHDFTLDNVPFYTVIMFMMK